MGDPKDDARRSGPAGAEPANTGTTPARKNRVFKGSSGGRIKRLAFRAALLVIPLFLLIAFELVLRVAGFGYPSHFFISDRVGGQRVVHDNQQFGWRFFPPAIARTPRPVSLPTPKPPGTCRIFVFGESAAYGDPVPAFGLPRVLEVLLRDRYPGVRFEVVNAAMTAINSNVILPIARDCAREQGDVWVIYMGNNEVVGPYGGGTVFGPQVPNLGLIRAGIALNGTRVGQIMDRIRQSLRRSTSAPSTVSLELFVDQQLRQDDPRMDKVYDHFARNLADILRVGTKAGAKVVVSTVASNLKDCPPFASLHRAGLSDSQKVEWDAAYKAGMDAEAATNLSTALEAFERTATLDDRYAELQFRLARTEWVLGHFESARSHYGLARDYDALRVRADSRINQLTREIAGNRVAESIAFVDGEAALEAKSPHGVPGQEVLFEHVHLNFTGNYWLARALAEQIERLQPAVLARNQPGGDWLSEQECFAHLGLTDWDRYEAQEILRERLARPPFTAQLGHGEQYARAKEESDKLKATLSQANLAGAVEIGRRALAMRPQDWVLHQRLAQSLARTGALPGAALEWEKVIEAVPHFGDAHYELGLLLQQQGESGKAVRQLRQAAKLNPYFANAHYALGRALAAENQLPEAIKSYERAVRLKPDYAEALVALRQALSGPDTNPSGLSRLPEALADGLYLAQMRKEGEQVREAIRINSEILKTNAQDAKAHYELAEALRLSGRYPEAEAHYAEAVNARPDFAEAHCMLGLALAKAGKQSQAIAEFSEALRLKPDLALAHLSMGVALAKQQRFVEAENHFQEALRLDPSDTNAQKYLKAARRAQGKTE